ncbi:MAG TPA: hypothetical protein VFS39_03825 [Nitrospira sp.]|nr:hypothetical protein [Nitrospira sp.]
MDRHAKRQASGTDHDTFRARDEVLAQLVGTSGWEALKSLLLAQTKHERIDFDHPQWSGKVAYHQGRVDLALDVMKAVEYAKDRHLKRSMH